VNTKSNRRTHVVAASLLALTLVAVPRHIRSAQQATATQPPPSQFGGSYSALDPRRQHLVDDFVVRFAAITNSKPEPGPFYDEQVVMSSKTTFDAITYALERTTLTDASGQRLGDALELVEHVESIHGQIDNASGDHQFRMYAVLEDGALDRLKRSQEFKREGDNTVYHHGYPINYRQLGGAPSIQFSIALDGRRADIDVDYRSSSFPAALFNGHLTAANSDVRAGNNYDRHTGRWNGFQNWWRNFFGIGLSGSSDNPPDQRSQILPRTPRIGDQDVDMMMADFLKAWLIEGNVPEAMAYVSPHSYACLAQDSDDPFTVDRGTAPFILSRNLKAAYDTLGPHTSLEGLTVGVRLTLPALQVVKQPHHAQYVIYSIPDDVAMAISCESRLRLDDPKKSRRRYGNYFGATFNINTPAGREHSIALLWARDDDYWKIVSWKADPAGDDHEQRDASPAVKTVKIKADDTLVAAARGFLESWLLHKDYDAAFHYVSPKAYACYDLVRGPDQPAATSLEDAGRKIRANLESAGERIGERRSVDQFVEGVQPVHPAIRVMDHRYSRTFALGSLPVALAEASDCSFRARGGTFNSGATTEYGNAFGMTVRFKTAGGEAPVLRMLWQKDPEAWRITAYGIETP
jgi:hypothetical protein